ncbi:prepilin-type N-terminal cleavage/methylation domain-containing protein [Methylobacterium sp. GC_Met_3]|uniref:pilus assembly FimT family protein n=1 Tax=unclassified Methylobacterium TaxID=2615210 RepID=UPI00226AC4AD
MSAEGSIRNGAGDAGFTLVEMLVTLAIIGLAAGLAVQFAGSFNTGRRAGRLSGVIAAEIGLLHAEALRSAPTTRLTFEPASGRFLSSRAGAAPIPTAPIPVRIETAGAAAGMPPEIRFLPDGGSSGGRIVLGLPGGGAILSVSLLTARVDREAIR